MFGKAKKPSESPKELMARLAIRGPYRVLRGDLGIVGMPGQVFAPSSQTWLPARTRDSDRWPAIAFGHSWLADSGRYRDLLYHLASWGIVVAAPDAERGVLASDTALAAALRSALDVVSHVPLGFGAVKVDAERVGYAGDGLGASAAVLAASTAILHGQAPRPVRSVAAVFPAPTTATLLPAAETVTAQGLVIGGSILDGVHANPLPLAAAYGGDVVLRTLAGGASAALVEKFGPGRLLGFNGADRKVHSQVRALLAGYLLHSLTGDLEYQAFSDPEVVLGAFTTLDLDDTPDLLDPISTLLGATPPKKKTDPAIAS
ncbi:alpha/beta hydrolase [Gordonia pseudamarae]|uniref:Alpha/beta hydrolase n=1 Tax=Gordonia pseudamarae TaxID=2831662 RepID=A0ABX6IFN3_9ACTN|nr:MULTISPECIES: alpha/beta hydrolase [Gordonia]MBD0020441.1 alpha/beta hydrolase [Gordonia sp. (in: high G+C Gram-positive bacteria)]QHN25707.1 alpha/beta hydrolase [Gordonia pseudamarae]QHN34639.1 alpha/beta hydrolase [Gordonia pseudamarae]